MTCVTHKCSWSKPSKALKKEHHVLVDLGCHNKGIHTEGDYTAEIYFLELDPHVILANFWLGLSGWLVDEHRLLMVSSKTFPLCVLQDLLCPLFIPRGTANPVRPGPRSHHFI